MRILLINPPWGYGQHNMWKSISSVMPPLGLAWLGATLERAGHEVRILDAPAQRLGLDQMPATLRSLGSYETVGITATTAQIDAARAIAQAVKAETKSARVVLGGVHPTVLPEEVLSEPFVDLVVRGEGETTLLELAEERALETIKGISYRRDGVVRHNPDRGIIKDLDSLPMPAYHLLPMDRYQPAVGAYKRLPAVSVLATRGCPGKCSFCYRIFGSRVRVRSGRLVAEEVKLLQDRYGIKEVCFYDDTFTSVPKEVYEFCRGIEDLGVDLTWSCFSRVDRVDETLLCAMKEAGCHQIMYGIESASPIILRNIHKSTNLEEIRNAVRAAKKARIDVRAAFMIGNPGETPDTLKETLAFAMELNAELIVFNVTTPFPGTEMFRWADEKGYLTTRDWKLYDLAHPVMALPTISQSDIQQFYRQAYRSFYLRPRYLHMRLKKIRSMEDVSNAFSAMRGVLGI